MPENADNKYKKNFLSNVIIRIDFSPILKINKEISEIFQDEIRDDYPVIGGERTIKIRTKTQKDSEEKIFPIYKFSDNKKEKIITVTSQHLAIEDFNYKNFTEYKSIIDKIFTAFYKVYKPLNITRMGLRYQNEIKIKNGHPFELDDFLDSSLTFAINNFIETNDDISRFMNQINVSKDDFKIIFTYGIYNSDFPAKISRKEFILDYDCFTNEANAENLIEFLEKFNKKIKSLFEKSIKDKLRDIMEVTNV